MSENFIINPDGSIRKNKSYDRDVERLKYLTPTDVNRRNNTGIQEFMQNDRRRLISSVAISNMKPLEKFQDNGTEGLSTISKTIPTEKEFEIPDVRTNLHYWQSLPMDRIQKTEYDIETPHNIIDYRKFLEANDFVNQPRNFNFNFPDNPVELQTFDSSSVNMRTEIGEVHKESKKSLPAHHQGSNRTFEH